jgi:CRISPR-associated protein Csy1
MLAPLFASSLVHAVHERLREVRFSDAAKAARAAKRDGRAHHTGYSNYLGTAIRVIGGSKPQNISLLNSERGGVNELLSSVPPTWKDQGIKPPLGVATVFDGRGPVGGDTEIRAITKQLRSHLLGVVDRPSNLQIRDKRAQLVNAVIDRVLDIATALQCLPGGWSAERACELPGAQKQWLDQDAVTAAKTAVEKSQGDTSSAPETREWRERVAGDFAKWLCAQISTGTTPMGDPEYVFLKHEFLKVMP